MKAIFSTSTAALIGPLDRTVSGGQSAVCLALPLLSVLPPSSQGDVLVIFSMLLLLGGHFVSGICVFTIWIKFGNISATISSNMYIFEIYL